MAFFYGAQGQLHSTKSGSTEAVAQLPQPAVAGAQLGSGFWFLLADRRTIIDHKASQTLTPSGGDEIVNFCSFRNKLYSASQGAGGGPSIQAFDPVADKDVDYRNESIQVTGLQAETRLLNFHCMNRGFLISVVSTAEGSVSGTVSLYTVDRKGAAKPVVDSRLEKATSVIMWPGSISSDCRVLTDVANVTVSDDGSVSALPPSFNSEDCRRASAWLQAGGDSHPLKNSAGTWDVPLLHTGVEFAALTDAQKGQLANADGSGCFWFPEAVAEALEMCPICFCEFESDDEGNCGAVTLDCGHGFHVDCLTQCIAMAENYLPKGQRIVFNMAKCPGGCGHLIRHPVFPSSSIIVDRYEKVLQDTAGRAAIEYPSDKPATIMDKYLHYVCHKCQDPYWGGNKDCAAMMTEPTCDPDQLVCEKCADDFRCPDHGRDYVLYKCAHCCRPANHFSFGRRRICEECMADPERQKTTQPCSGATCGLPAGHPTEDSFPVGCLACLDNTKFDIGKVPEFVAPKKAEG